jgi:hypothetical protein
MCCNGSCVAPYNDPRNCGGCGIACPADRPFCNGECMERPCQDPTECPGGDCCGSVCCDPGQLCCMVTLGPTVLLCHTPTEVEPTCPPGCPTCDCAAPDTPIATPAGERPIASLRVGDLVYSVDHDAIVAVPLRRVHRQAVEHHHVMRVRLATGALLQLSPGHPTADGAVFGDLRPGSALDGVSIVEAELVRYELPYTHDILPDSDTGAYFAAGVLVGSTLARE